MTTRILGRTLAAAALVLATGNAVATPTLIGDSVLVRYATPNLTTTIRSDTVTVGAGVEIACPGASTLCVTTGTAGLVNGESIDLGALSIAGTFVIGFGSYAFHGFEFSGLDFGGGDLIGFALSTNIPNFTSSDITFDARALRMNLAGVTGGGAFDIQLQVSPTSVPLPGTLTLAVLGLGLVAGSRRRSG